MTSTPLSYYIGGMKRIASVALLAITLFLAPLWGAVQIRDGMGLSIEGGFYGSIPSKFHDDPVAMRTHATFGGTLRPVIIGVGQKSELSLGISTFYTTRSIVYGTTSWRSALLVGLSFSYTYNFNRSWSLSGEVHGMASINLEIKEATPLIRISVTPLYTFGKRHQLALALPVSIDLRTDYVALVSTFSLYYRFDKRGLKE